MPREDVLVLLLLVGSDQHFIAAQGDIRRGPLRTQLLVGVALKFLLDQVLGCGVFFAGIGFGGDPGS